MTTALLLSTMTQFHESTFLDIEKNLVFVYVVVVNLESRGLYCLGFIRYNFFIKSRSVNVLNASEWIIHFLS